MIDYIRLKNICAYPDETIHFPPSGLTVLSGRSGAGKSTVLSAIGLCLFNSLDMTHKDFIRHEASWGNIIVGLSGGYKVSRQIGSDACWLVATDHAVVAEGVEEVSTWIKHQLGIPEEYDLEAIWHNIVYIKQFDIVSPFQATPGIRKSYFDAIFGLDQYEKTWGKMRSVLSGLSSRDTMLSADLRIAESREERLSETTKQIENLGKLQEEAEDSLCGIDDIASEEIEELETDLWVAQEILRLEARKATVKHFETCPTCGQAIDKEQADGISVEIDKEIQGRKIGMREPDWTVEQIKAELSRWREAQASRREIISGMQYRAQEMERLARIADGIRGEGQSTSDLRDELNKIELALIKANDIRSGFREVKPLIGDALLKAVSRRANDMFREVWTDGSLEWQPGYELTPAPYGKKLSFTQCSGGQRVTAALATRMAMAQVVADIGLLIVDEPTMGAVDGVTAEMLRPMFIRSGQTILVDHGGHFLDMAHRLVEIENEDGVSCIVK